MQTLQRTPTHPDLKAALLHLSSLCDGASSLDGQGFNGADSDFGKSLASKCRYGLSQDQQIAAQKMLRKYTKQLNKAGIKNPTQPELNNFLEMLTVEDLGDGQYLVKNTLKGSSYTVTFQNGFGDCECPHHQAQDIECKHIAAVRAEYEIAEDEPAEPEPEPEPELEPEADEPLTLPPAQIKTGLVLNEQQRRAIALMTRFYFSKPVEGKPSFFLLKGYAGTGKTTVIQELVKLLRESQRLFICMVAPTNKAVKVLQRMAAKAGLTNVDFATVYQLMGLKLVVNDDGKEQVQGDPNGSVSIDNYDLVICDESSMLNKHLWKLLSGICRGGKPKVIFMGDPCQLPPVGEHESKVFDLPDDATAELTQVVRYGSAIGELVTQVRENIFTKEPIQPYSIKSEDTPELVQVLDKFDWLDLLIEQFQSDSYKANPDHVRALAWTNKVVSWINKHVREQIYGTNTPQYIVGERLIASKPVMVEGMSGRKEIAMQTASECEVFSVQPYNYNGYESWKLWLNTDDNRRISVICLSEGHSDKWIEDLEQIKLAAYEMPTGSDQCKAQWRKYYSLKEAFAPLKYGYAQTVHTSQGSTFQNVFVALSDVLRNRKPIERNQLCYVAYSRAAQALYISE